MKQHLRLFLALSLTTAALLGMLTQVKAQNAFDVTVSPPTAYLQIKPGSKASHQIKLTNNTSGAVTVVPRIFDSKPLGETGYPQLQTTFTFPYLENQSASLEPLTINPGETVSYVLNFIVPPAAATKEYPLTVLFSKVIEQDSLSKNNTTRSQLYGAVGSNIVVLVSDSTNVPNQLKIVEIQQSVFQDSLKRLQFEPKLLNQGVQAVAASGSATITNMFGKVVYQADLYPDILLGGQQRPARAFQPGTTDEPPKPIAFSYDPPFLLGRYTIAVSLTDQAGDLLNSSSTTLVALPYSIIGAIVIALLTWFIARASKRSLDQSRQN